VDHLAYAIDHRMELLSDLGIFRHTAFKGVVGGIEEPPCRPVAPRVRRVLPCVHDGADALQVDQAIAFSFIRLTAL
jgi:hypothetical protein